MINLSYSKHKIKNYSEEFDTTVGLKQGDALSLTLLNIALKEIVRNVQEIVNGVSFNGKRHAFLAYANDVVIFGSKEEEIKNTTK